MQLWQTTLQMYQRVDPVIGSKSSVWICVTQKYMGIAQTTQQHRDFFCIAVFSGAEIHKQRHILILYLDFPKS